MRSDLRKLLIWLLPILLVITIFDYSSESLIARSYSAADTDAFRLAWNRLYPIVYWLGELGPGTVIAIWIWSVERRKSGSPILWSFAGFLLGTMALIPYLALYLLESIKEESTATVT